EGVKLILGNIEKYELTNILNELDISKSKRISNADISKTKEFMPSYSVGDRTRSFLKIQDGCDYFCSYCIIPIARGRSRSAKIIGVIANAKEIAKEGIKE